MFVRKDSVKTVDEYIKHCENLMQGQPLFREGMTACIQYAEELKKSPYEYIWVERR